MLFFFIHPIFLSRDTYGKWTSHYDFINLDGRKFAGVSLIEALIWIYINYSEKMKILKKNTIFFIHAIFLSRDTYEKWTHIYRFYKGHYQNCAGASIVEALISINDILTDFSTVYIERWQNVETAQRSACFSLMLLLMRWNKDSII